MTKHSNSKIAVVITAAGSSTRMGGSIKKEYLPLGNGTVLSACVKAFEQALNNPENNFDISHLIVTVPVNGIEQARKAISSGTVTFIEGSTTRQKSIFNALEYIKKSDVPADYVLIHDGARPFVTAQLICSVIQAAQQSGAAAPGIAPTDTIKVIDENGFITQHLERRLLTSIQTPQGFAFEQLYDAHKKAAADGHDYTDDSEIWGKYAGNVKLVQGELKNIKITYPGDLEKGAAL